MGPVQRLSSPEANFEMKSSRLVDGMVVMGHAVTREMQCMITGTVREGCSSSSVGIWLMYWTKFPLRDCDKIVDSVIAVCVQWEADAIILE